MPITVLLTFQRLRGRHCYYTSMLFNSYTFLIFLLIVIVTHNMVISSWRWQKVFLLLASYVFYAAWNPAFILLIWASTLTDWFAARWMYGTRDRLRKRAFLLLSLSVNLVLLGFFKYGQSSNPSAIWSAASGWARIHAPSRLNTRECCYSSG